MSEESPWNKHHFNVLEKVAADEEFANLDADAVRKLADEGMITTRSMYRRKNGTCHFTPPGERLHKELEAKFGEAKPE
jgi:hypothetical protein